MQTDDNKNISDEKAWDNYFNHQGSEVAKDIKAKNDQFEAQYAQEEIENSYEFVQLNNDFFDDHDIPTNPWYDQLEVTDHNHGEDFLTRAEQQKLAQDEKLQT